MFCNWTLGTGLYWKLSDGKEDLISLSSLPSGQFISASLDFNAKVQNKIKFYFEQFSSNFISYNIINEIVFGLREEKKQTEE